MKAVNKSSEPVVCGKFYELKAISYQKTNKRGVCLLLSFLLMQKIHSPNRGKKKTALADVIIRLHQTVY